MMRRLVTSLVCASALITLAACGQATEAADDGGSTAPSATSSPSTGATEGDSPAMPTSGCTAGSVASVDYAREPQGYPTPEEAVKAGGVGNIPDGTVMAAPAGDGRGTEIWVVDPSTNTVKAEVSLVRGSTGWYVDQVTTCA